MPELRYNQMDMIKRRKIAEKLIHAIEQSDGDVARGYDLVMGEGAFKNLAESFQDDLFSAIEKQQNERQNE